jgi:hypothetical protein
VLRRDPSHPSAKAGLNDLLHSRRARARATPRSSRGEMDHACGRLAVQNRSTSRPSVFRTGPGAHPSSRWSVPIFRWAFAVRLLKLLYAHGDLPRQL